MPSRSSSSSSQKHRRRLVSELQELGYLRSEPVRRAFLRVPRELFVPDVAAREGLAKVYANEVHVTRWGPNRTPISSSSQPSIMAEMLERLDLRPGLRVLEIGAGTGYNAALLATLVGPKGSVTSVDVEMEVAEKAASALREGGYPVRVLVADAQLGLYGESPFDRILLTASSDHVARAWFEQLVPGGLIELPYRLGRSGAWDQVVVTLHKEGDQLRSVAVVSGGFMYLRDPERSGGEPPPGTVSVSERVDGEHRVFADLTGPDLGRVPSEARRRLARLLLERPRVRTLSVDGPADQSLLPYVALQPPPAGTVTVRTFRDEFRERNWFGVGLAARDGRSVAMLIGGREGRVRMEMYGAQEAATALSAGVTRWRRAGRPKIGDMCMTVDFAGVERRPAVAIGWNRP